MEQYFAGGHCWVPCVGGASFIYLLPSATDLEGERGTNYALSLVKCPWRLYRAKYILCLRGRTGLARSLRLFPLLAVYLLHAASDRVAPYTVRNNLVKNRRPSESFFSKRHRKFPKTFIIELHCYNTTSIINFAVPHL